MEIQALMERRVMGNCHARCGPGENLEITSKDYLSEYYFLVQPSNSLF